MREALKPKYRFALIRVRFPDGFVIQVLPSTLICFVLLARLARMLGSACRSVSRNLSSSFHRGRVMVRSSSTLCCLGDVASCGGRKGCWRSDCVEECKRVADAQERLEGEGRGYTVEVLGLEGKGLGWRMKGQGAEGESPGWGGEG